MKIGYFLSCEEFGPRDLLEQARMVEEAGFEGLWISDHYHPGRAAPDPGLRFRPGGHAARREDMISQSISCGPVPEPHREMIRSFTEAGYDEAYIQQIGPNQKQFFDLYEKEILPEFSLSASPV